jgi:hypothetical protein
MAASLERSELHVEGPDDHHSIMHLLIRHGIGGDPQQIPAALPVINEAGSLEKLLRGINPGVKASTNRAVGFVLDADTPIQDRWRSVRDRLSRVGVTAPATPVSEGFIGTSTTFRSKVGVWLMPDNQQDGKLETFLQTLIAANDPLIPHADSATTTATQLGAKFTGPDRVKAVIHAWLAWQEEPGLPYGTAIKARYFQHDSPAARAFVAWFKQLYDIT